MELDGVHVTASGLPAGRLAVVTHVGPYDELGAAWGRFMGWVASQGLSPDDRYGEEICACIMARDASLTAEELRAFCKGQIAHYKVPRYVEFVDEFPMTVTGKVQKFILRDQMVLRIFPQEQAQAQTQAG